MRKGRYSSGDTPLDKDVDTALKQEVDRIARERSGASGENGQTPAVPPRSPELQAYYTGKSPRRKAAEIKKDMEAVSEIEIEDLNGSDQVTEPEEPNVSEQSDEVRQPEGPERIARRPGSSGRRVISKVDVEEEEDMISDDDDSDDSFYLDDNDIEDRKSRDAEAKRKKAQRQEIFSIIGYFVYHFVCMGLIALCVILIYFCIKFIDVSDHKTGQTVYHYHEGESDSQANGE